MTRLAALAAVTLTGCSLFLTAPARDASDCTSSRAAPITDTVLASAASLVLLTGLGLASTGCPHDDDRVCSGFSVLFIGGGTLLSAAYWPSAAVGYSRTARCDELRAHAQIVTTDPEK
jgi:hypothetical protein